MIWRLLQLVVGPAVLLGACAHSSLAHAADAPPQAIAKLDVKDVEFFERKIRPALHKHCYSCHSAEAKKVKGGLFLDSRADWMRGGDSGAAIKPDDPDNSLFIKAIRYDDAHLQMPPKGKLPDAVINDFVDWVRRGAPDPRAGQGAGQSAGAGIDVEKGRQFWAFQPVRRVTPPNVKDESWPRNDVDRFVLARLESANVKPVGDADRRTLIRRLYFDLIGLPPTPAQVEAFVNDKSPDAVERVVDALLASPRFGERWGRHWLDVARHADSNGGDINVTYHQAWRYRDYVINAFNNDKPFDRFIVEQIAGDLMASNSDAERAERLIATGFLVIGPKMLSERDKEKLRMDVVDEQVDTIGRAFLGMTLGCARCHDHKFDPIPTTDYYAMAGVFRSTQTIAGNKLGNVFVSGWLERELPANDEQKEAIAAHKKATDDLNAKLKSAKAEQKKLADQQAKRGAPKLAGIVVDDTAARKNGTWKDSTYVSSYVGKGYVHDNKEGKGEFSVVYTPDLPAAGNYEVRISYTPGNGRARSVPITVRYTGGEKTIRVNQETKPPIDNLFVSLGRYQFEKGRAGSVTISTKGTDGYYVIADAVQFIPLDDDGKPKVQPAESKPKHDDGLQQRLTAATRRVTQLEKQAADLKKQAPKTIPKVMAVQDRPEVGDWHVHVRGEVRNHGPKVPRGVLSVATTEEPNLQLPPTHSGRLELAQWIVNKDNPLTARVAVNRVWHHLFGAGLVPTVDNFGSLGQRPSHRELLDYLADRFVAEGWSIKKAIRRVVLSRTYQLASDHDSVGFAIDPENRLLYRQNRRRLQGEAIRDAILSISGQLDVTSGGSPVASLGESAIANSAGQQGGIDTDRIKRRSVYLPIIRNDVAPFLSVFDIADPEMVTGRRAVTTTPAQALLMLNSPFVRDNARATAELLLAKEVPDDAGRVGEAYRLILGRPASRLERDRALAFLRQRPQATGDNAAAATDLARWTALCQAIMASTEFRFLD